MDDNALDEMLAEWAAVKLTQLRDDWDSAYEISADGPDWRAARRDDGSVITANGPHELRARIRADYLARPVHR